MEKAETRAEMEAEMENEQKAETRTEKRAGAKAGAKAGARAGARAGVRVEKKAGDAKKALTLGAGAAVAAVAAVGVGVSVGAGALIADTPLGTASADPIQPALCAEQPDNVAFYKTDLVTLDVVEGSFAFTQSAVSTNEEIRNNLGAAKYLCGARAVGEQGSVSVDEWQISVGGAVAKPFTATFDELVSTNEVQSLLLGCSCAGNPSDGRASANAEVTGISALLMIEMAGVDAEANTVVFTSADGYEVALPLSYLRNRYCPIVFDVNGAPLAESVGGTNQLWLGSTSANYFARDIVAITLECREEAPASPFSDEAREAYANLPNVGVLLGGSVA